MKAPPVLELVTVHLPLMFRGRSRQDSLPVDRPCHHPRFALVATAAALILIPGVGGIGGCAVYRPSPASREAIDAALQPPEPSELVQEAAKLRHPTLPPVTLAADGSLSPDAAAVVAVIQNPSLRAIRDRRGIAAAQLLEAGILPNPQLAASLDFPNFGATEGTVNAFSLGATWDVTSLLTRGAARSAASHQAVVADLEVAWQEWQAAMGAKLHAIRVLWLSRQREELDQQVSQAAGVAEQAERNASDGLVTSLERDAAASLAQRRRTALYAADAMLRAENVLLRQSLGLPSDTTLRISAGDDPADVAKPPTAQIAAIIDESRLDLAALRAGYAAQEEKLRGAVLSQFPKIGLGVTRARDTTNVGTIGFGITLDLPIFDRGQGRIAIETATRQQLFDELAARTFDARSDAAKAYEDLDAVRPQIQEADRTVDRLSRLSSSLEAAQREGHTDIVQLNQIRNDLADARVEALKLRQQEAELRVAVEVATGRLQGGSRQ
jgi:outer membrane protein TolC